MAESGDGTEDGPIEESSVYKNMNRLFERLFTIRDEKIESIARTAEDPINVLLALEMGAFMYGPDSLPVYDKLIHLLDKDLVGNMQTAANRHSLVPGKKAPEFALPDLVGEVVRAEGCCW